MRVFENTMCIGIFLQYFMMIDMLRTVISQNILHHLSSFKI